MTCAVRFTRGKGWDADAVEADGSGLVTHSAPSIVMHGETWVLDASHTGPVRLMTGEQWDAKYADQNPEVIELPGYDPAPAWRWFIDLNGSRYDWRGGVIWRLFKPVLFICSKCGWRREDPEAYHCTEATIRAFHEQGFMAHIPEDNWHRVHPAELRTFCMARSTGGVFGG